MKPFALASLLILFAGCRPRPTEAGLLVVVTVETGVTSKCLQVEVVTQGSRRASEPLRLTGKSTYRVGVAQSTFPETVELRAVGFLDEGCETRAPEESELRTGTFSQEPYTQVALSLRPRGPRTEQRCGDGLDDDRDGQVDCADSDCDAQPCTSAALCLEGTRCSNGTCGGGAMRQCLTPPSGCFQPTGVCSVFDGGCQYALAANPTCNDNDACTMTDRCEADGTCRGTPRTCEQSANACLERLGGCADGGCLFAAREDAGCDDADSCTLGDRCSESGTCAGTRLSCVPQTCQRFSGRCDGGCVFEQEDAGTACDGGLCNAFGNCLPRFPFQPTNFDVPQLKQPPAQPTVLDCGETVIDTAGTGAPRLTNWCRGQAFESSVVRQPNGPDAVLVSLSGLTIASDAGLVLIGDKPVILAVQGDVSILGSIVARSGTSACAQSRGQDGQSGALTNSGGSGAGFSTVGGEGGRGTGLNLTPGGGVDPQSGPSPLRGGCRGGRGADQSNPAAEGGGGLQITAARTLAINGVIAAPGRGGRGGNWQFVKGEGGNGGGSGGLILLEALELTLTGGAVTANGGGGGEGGGVVGGANGTPGTDGTLDSVTPASGGNGGATLGGPGGAGGATVPPAAGSDNTAGGGGGGAPGRIFLRGVSSCGATGVVFSPLPADGGCP